MRIGPLRLKRQVLTFAGVSVGCLIGVLCVASWFTRQSAALPTFAAVRARYQPSDKWILDRDGLPLESIRSSQASRSLDWTTWEEVSPSLQRELIATEDRHFQTHVGVDLAAMASAGWSSLRGHRQRGASTITMQVYDRLTQAKENRASRLGRKLRQVLGGLALDDAWSKNEILEAYVNLIPFRGELIGLRAASWGLLGKSPRALDEVESALLVALIRAPNAPSQIVAQRACWILKRTNCVEMGALAARVLDSPYQIARERDLVPVLAARFVTSDPKSSIIQTTLERKIQAAALQSVREQMRELREKNVNDAAVVVLETRTGRILAYVGNAGLGLASRPQIDGAAMRRQAGSSLKPFVYATAYDMRLLDLSSLIEDSPEDLGVGSGSVYNPRNYDHSFEGLVSSGEALASSLNVPAVRTLEMAGEARVLDRLRALGFTALRDEDHYGPSLALGTVDVSLIELTEAYRRLSLFADTRVFSNETKEKIFAALSRPEYRRFTFGIDGILNLPFPVAVKTGTSKDMRDNWCVGFTSEYTIGVWVGNFDGESMWNVSGITGAAPIWRRLMAELHPTPPRDLIYPFIPPAEALPKSTMARIRYPQIDMLLGMDPDIPKHLQQLPIKVDHPQRGQMVYVDGRKLSAAHELNLWPLSKGRHEIELRTRIGHLVDHVQFFVR